jgi:hypothetical protein
MEVPNTFAFRKLLQEPSGQLSASEKMAIFETNALAQRVYVNVSLNFDWSRTQTRLRTQSLLLDVAYVRYWPLADIGVCTAFICFHV